MPKKMAGAFTHPTCLTCVAFEQRFGPGEGEFDRRKKKKNSNVRGGARGAGGCCYKLIGALIQPLNSTVVRHLKPIKFGTARVRQALPCWHVSGTAWVSNVVPISMHTL